MSSEIECRFCGSKDIWKSGHVEVNKQKKQRYQCKSCNKKFRIDNELESESYVKCMICGQYFLFINNSHLKLHNLNMKQYKERYPNIEVSSNLLKKELSIGLGRYFSDPVNRKKLSKKKLEWFKNNPEKVEELKRKIRKSTQTKEFRKLRSKLSKEWIKNNPEKWNEIKKEITEKSRTPEMRRHMSKKTTEWFENYPEEWKETNEKRIKKLKSIKFRRKRSEEMKRYFKEHPELKKEHSKKLIKWFKNHQKEWEIVKKKMSITRSKPEFRKKISKVMKKYSEDHPELKEEHSKRMKKLFSNEEWVRGWFKKSNIKPNKPEKILIKLLKEKNLPYEYVGDFKFMIGSKNPDFINIDKKKVIELFGHFWHLEKIEGSIKKHIEERKNHFKKHGYNTLVIWDYELKDPTKVIEKITEFDKI